ncbi:MAG TPA: hypothetical protein VMV51_07995 [Gemmatimonadaceae bacterium]|nr:hypothetical protein [Gemmatimonadaceae bacterium]
MIRPPWIPCITAVLIASAVRAQTPPARIDLTLTGPAHSPTLAGAGLAGGSVRFDPAAGVQVVVACSAPLSCAKLAARADEAIANDFIANAQGQSFALVVPAGPARDTLAIPLAYDGHAVLPALTLYGVTGARAQPTATADAAPDTPPPLALRVRNKRCANSITVPGGDVYVVWLDGTPISSPARPLVEGESAEFYIVGETALINRVKVVRKSALRTVTVSNVLGATVNAAGAAPEFNRQGLPVTTCGVFHAEFNDLAPGAAEVEIDVLGDDGTTELKNSFDFDVNALYTGAYTFGAIRTNVGSPAFAKVYNGADTVVSTTVDAGRRIQYVMTYTPFVWGARDVTRPPARWYEAIDPFVGIVLNDVPNDAIAGLSYSVGSMLYVIGGVHAARVLRLDANAGAEMGKPFENRAASVPTVKSWKAGWFWGISVDLQGAVGLLKTALSATTAATGAAGK